MVCTYKIHLIGNYILQLAQKKSSSKQWGDHIGCQTVNNFGFDVINAWSEIHGSFEMKRNFARVLDQKKLSWYPWLQFMVMLSGIANDLCPNRVDPGICTHAEVYIIMDHKAGERCF